MNGSGKYNSLKNRLIGIYCRNHPPDRGEFLLVLDRINSVLLAEDEEIRPRSNAGLPGGLIQLKKNIPSIIVPDLHARMDFFLNLMLGAKDGSDNLTLLENDELQIICVGDGVHAEKRAAKRWSAAFREFEGDYLKHDNIDAEMRESFGLMEMVMEVKAAYPRNFHFLKGNHENITNEEGNGNYPFIKFSYEGPMVAYYVEKFYGAGFLRSYDIFEKNLPLFAAGRNFLVSHAEPMRFFSREEIIEYRNLPHVVEGLTWTADDAAGDRSVSDMLNHYIDEAYRDKSYYFGGHRPVAGLHNARAEGRYIQIHNPKLFVIASIRSVGDIDLDNDIVKLEDRIDEIAVCS